MGTPSLGLRPRGSLRERVERRLEKTATCWLWRGYRKKSGHGMIWSPKEGRPAHVHRAYWEEVVGPIPAGLHLLHKCDVPNCVNPAHLYVGTHADNMRDALERHRFRPAAQPGETNGFAKLTAAQVVAIRNKYEKHGESQYALAAEFGVSQLHISRIVRRVVWRHIQ